METYTIYVFPWGIEERHFIVQFFLFFFRDTWDPWDVQTGARPDQAEALRREPHQARALLRLQALEKW